MKIEKSELLRYLGYKGQRYDGNIDEKIDRAIEICLSCITPRYVVKRYALSKTPLSLIGANLPLLGRDIEKHLKESDAAYIFGATLGFGLEKTVSRFVKDDPLTALLLDSAGTCAIESYCDDVCEELQSREQNQLTSRFSCGYGDFPLSLQGAFANVLEMPKRIGVFVDGASYMMSPQKSVTAVVGIRNTKKAVCGERADKCNLKCADCSNIGCEFRKV